MAIKNLKTDWQTIGRSGPTTDGREIKAEWLTDAAEHYDPAVFAALIWPDHYHYVNYGKVEALRTVPNAEGGVDLQAIIAPNENYIFDNRNGQLLFFSMEIQEDFAKKGHAYLVGLACTDNPASLGTSEIRFSAAKHGGILLSNAFEAQAAQFKHSNNDEKSFFEHCRNFFTKNTPEDDDMPDNAQIEALKTDIAKLTGLLNEFKKQETPPAEKPDGMVTVAEFEKLKADLAELQSKYTAAPPVDAAKLAEFGAQLVALSAKLDAALKEQSGTDGGDDAGDTEADKAYA